MGSGPATAATVRMTCHHLAESKTNSDPSGFVTSSPPYSVRSIADTYQLAWLTVASSSFIAITSLGRVQSWVEAQILALQVVLEPQLVLHPVRMGHKQATTEVTRSACLSTMGH